MADESRPTAASSRGAGRRTFLLGTGAAATAALATATPVAAAPDPQSRSAWGHRTQVVLVGTAGGPAVQGEGRMGICTAVVYDGKAYIVDLGQGSQMNFHRAGISPIGSMGGTLLANVRGIFFTHLHSDHMVEWPAVYSTAPVNQTGRDTRQAIKVFGPGDRGSLVRVFPPNRPTPALYNPEDSTPGIAGITAHLRNAFATDFNDRTRDSNFLSPDVVFDVQEIDLAGIWDVDPEGVPPRLSEPIQVWQDGDVQITATLVDHRPTAPAFAYRFDTPDGSVVVSGDTGVSENLIDLARDCDYLVHEVIDPQYVEDLAATMPPEMGEPLKNHLLESHTTIEQVGRDVAEVAGAKNLVLTHFVPADNPAKRWRRAQQGYRGNLIVGEDLLALSVGKRRQGRH